MSTTRHVTSRHVMTDRVEFELCRDVDDTLFPRRGFEAEKLCLEGTMYLLVAVL